MVRPIKKRCVCRKANEYYFKPAGIPSCDLEKIKLNADEYEAIRLADYEGDYHDAAAQKMKISRQTFGRIIESSRKKIADALVHGKAIVITCEGPVVFGKDGLSLKKRVKGRR